MCSLESNRAQLRAGTQALGSANELARRTGSRTKRVCWDINHVRVVCIYVVTREGNAHWRRLFVM